MYALWDNWPNLAKSHIHQLTQLPLFDFMTTILHKRNDLEHIAFGQDAHFLFFCVCVTIRYSLYKIDIKKIYC